MLCILITYIIYLIINSMKNQYNIHFNNAYIA